MINLDRPLVSFVVPTLNRRDLVRRAIQSCLSVETESVDVDIQVVVSDSGSTDGSWEMLNQTFGQDPRVILVQSPKGSTPLQNWLNGVKYIQGDYVTFVWSDDYIAPHFLSTLLPVLKEGEALAIGHGAIREVDDLSPLPQRNAQETLAPAGYVAGYFTDVITSPVSPTCSLFSRAVFEQWKAQIDGWTQVNSLRRNLCWHRAIGPDLIVYFLALLEGHRRVRILASDTAHFSFHSGSISCSTSNLPFMLGYWLACMFLLTDARAVDLLGRRSYVKFSAKMYIYGLALRLMSVFDRSDPSAEYRSCIADELRVLAQAVRRSGGGLSFEVSRVVCLPAMLVILLRYSTLNRWRRSWQAFLLSCFRR